MSLKNVVPLGSCREVAVFLQDCGPALVQLLQHGLVLWKSSLHQRNGLSDSKHKYKEKINDIQDFNSL